MSSDDEDPGVLSLLDDDTARTILIETSREPMSATELSEACGVSGPTIYRRLERLEAHDLVREQQALDPGGHHYKAYTAHVERVTVEFDDGTCTIEITRPEADPADRFTQLLEDLK